MKLLKIEFFVTLKYSLGAIFFILHLSLFGQETKPNIAETRLNEVLEYYTKYAADSLKLKAARFLLANMPIHGSQTYYWQDSLGTEVEFDELDYDDFRSSVNALSELSNEKGGLKPKPIFIPDTNAITSDLLIRFIDDAFDTYDPRMDFDLFCEYVLPYRVGVEPLSNWRTTYNQRFSRIIDGTIPLKEKIELLKENLMNWFVCTYNIEKRLDPLPLLSALQLLHRKKGPCEDVADLSVFAFRSLGIPSAVDFVPYWGTSTGGHTLNTVFDKKGNPVHFDILSQSDSLHEFIREPAKVFRITYSDNPKTLAVRFPDAALSFYGFLKKTNYIDVTDEYWPTRDVTFELFSEVADSTVVYACVFNGEKWRPVWWGVAKDSKVTTTNMSQGVVYVPKIVKDGKLVTVGYPVANGYDWVKVLEPFSVDENSLNQNVTHNISLHELKKYIKFKPNEKYRLYFYDRKWKSIADRVGGDNTIELKFAFIPKNALLFLRYKSSRGKGRPFIITDEGKRLWW